MSPPPTDKPPDKVGYQIRVTKRMIVPASSMCVMRDAFVRVNGVDKKITTWVADTPSNVDLTPSHSKLCRIGRTIHTLPSVKKGERAEQLRLNLNITNLHSCPVLLLKGSIIGTLTPIDLDDIRLLESADREKSADVRKELSDEIRAKLSIDKESMMRDDSDKERIWSALEPYVHVFDTRELGEARHILGQRVEHTIDTGEAKPIAKHPYRQAPAMEARIDDRIEQLLQQGAVRPSASPWSSPIVMVRKPGVDNWRMCVDYRGVNSVTIPDVYPIPPVDSLLYSMEGASVFTTLDLQDAYHQIKIVESDIGKTAFVHRRGLYEYIRMPFGLRNAPATFQRYVNGMLNVLRIKLESQEQLWSEDESMLMTFKHLLGYLDDIILFSETIEQHANQLKVLFKLLSMHGLKVKLSKCEFARKSVKYLGHIIDGSGIHVDPGKVQGVKEMPAPKNMTDVRSFLGMVGYYRKFIPSYTELACPLYELEKKDKEWDWSEECQRAFENLKSKLTSAPVLVMPDFTKPFILQTDASYVGVGAVLCQEHNVEGEKVDKPIAYVSRALRKAERNYAAYEIELLALVYAIKQFRNFIMGSRFLVQTDHRALQWLRTSKDLSGRLARWAMLLQEFDFDIVYRKGSQNGNADGLSRLPVESDVDGVAGLDEVSLKQIRSVKKIPRSLLFLSALPLPTNVIGVSNRSDRDFVHRCEKNSTALRVTRTRKVYMEQKRERADLMLQESRNSSPIIPSLPAVDEDDEDELEEGEYRPDMHSSLVNSSSEDNEDGLEYKHDAGSDEEEVTSAIVEDVKESKQSEENANAWEKIRDDIQASDMIIESESAEKLLAERQKGDPNWSNLYKFLDTGVFPPACSASEERKLLDESNHFILKEGVLYRVFVSNKSVDKGFILQVCLPKSDVPKILRELHTEPIGGHLSTAKVFNKAVTRYYWPRMYSEIERYCRECEVCIRKQKPHHSYKSPMLSPEQDRYDQYAAGEGIAVDVIGPITSSGKKSLILTVVDMYTREGEAYPLYRQTTREIVQTLVREWMLRRGIPRAILSDNGSGFASKIMRACMKTLGVRTDYIIPYRPQSNGVCERLNGTIINMLKAYVYDDQRKWTEYLPYVCFAYNTSVHPATGYTPFFLTHGREAKIGSDAVLDIDSTYPSLPEYVQRLLTNFAVSHEGIGERVIERKQIRESKNEENVRAYREFEIGSRVYIFIKPKSEKSKDQSKKLMLTYEGPYVVKRKINDVTYKCYEESNPRISRLAHFSQMKSADGVKPTKGVRWESKRNEESDEENMDDAGDV